MLNVLNEQDRDTYDQQYRKYMLELKLPEFQDT